jgi:sterol desaturase/sphingolipid hydroxylase (fatty acid hydroxylase superfamily)
MPRLCKFCGEDMANIPPTTAITRHIVGLCAPSHNSAAAALEEFEMQNIREQEMIRKQFERVKSKPIEVTNRSVQWFVCCIVVGALVLYAFAWMRAIPFLQ